MPAVQEVIVLGPGVVRALTGATLINAIVILAGLQMLN